MPNPRSLIKSAHERHQVDLLIKELNHRHRSSFQVIEEPDPPEAIIRSGRTTRWAEVVTAYWNTAYARDLNSYATPGEAHVPVRKGLHIDMDCSFACEFVKAVKSKLEKDSYVPFRDQYGPGYLVVSIQYPFLDAETFESIREEWRRCHVDDLRCFRSIYVTFPANNGYRVVRWEPD